jgi:hypothetical protein
MADSFKVHAFRVARINGSPSLDDLLDEVEGDALGARVRTIYGTDLRIEHIERRQGTWYMDFGKFRDEHGPGKASRATPIEGFEFDGDEAFCEETACLYQPTSGHLLVQYNHYGARAGSIQEYFNTYSHDEAYAIELQPRYDDDAYRRFSDRAASKRLTIGIDPRFLNENDRAAGLPLAQALDLGNESNGTKIEITISVGKARNRWLSEPIERFLERLPAVINRNPDAVTKLKVGVVETLDSAVETIDLIAQRLSKEFTDLIIDDDHRYPREDRYVRLRRAWNLWRGRLQQN